MKFEDLDNPEIRQKMDPNNVYGSTGTLSGQCKQIWEEAKKINFQGFADINSVIVCGMGGSAYGGYVVSSLFSDKLAVPLLTLNDYHLPAWVNEKTLVIASSYSGTTEESLSCIQEAIDKKAQITGLTGGGKLAEILNTNKIPALIFNPSLNPSKQPRLGTGYMILGMIAILVRLGFLSVSDEEVQSAISELEAAQEEIKSQARNIASKLEGAIPVIFAAEFLDGNSHIIRNQLNETAKSFAAFSPLPELNHHLMEGLKNPSDKKLCILFIDSDLYSDKLQKRVAITKDVVEKNNIPQVNYQPKGSSKLSQMLNVLSFGGYVSLYLAFLYDQDPSVIPWVDYFKAQIAKT